MPKKAIKKTPENGSGHHYRAEDITVLEGLEPVQRRPGMYIGTTGPDGLRQLIWEVFDNARDEAMGGFASDVEVALLPENRVRVVDNGRGIPVDTHKQTKVSALETIMTTLHAGGKFDTKSYKIAGGLHGVGVSVVNALSTYAKVEVHRDGGVHLQEYTRGKRKAKVKKVASSKQTGTIVTFEPDPNVFKSIQFEWERVISHLRQQAYLVKGLRITVIDAREHTEKLDLIGKAGADKVFYFRELGLEVPRVTFYFEGGLLSLVKFYNERQKPIHKNIFYVEKEIANPEAKDGTAIVVEVSLQYVDDISSRLLAFANNTYNPEGGMHLTGFKTALTRTINSYGKANNIIKNSEESFTGDDVLEGLTAVISVKLPEVQFEGQTKVKLGSVEARGAVETVFGEAFNAFLEEHPDDARAIIGKVVLALKSRKAAKAAKDSVLRKGALEGLTLPGKLADCQSRSAEESELFIVEGDSAGGCFSGDTKVALPDGRHLSFKELVAEDKVGKKNYCYTIGKSGNIEIGRIVHPRITKKNVQVVKVVLDSGEEIVCTPDHKFMLRDGSYKEVQNLTPHDSLIPLRRQLSRLGKRITIKGYEMVFDPADHRWIFTHLLADAYNVGKGLLGRKKTSEALHHKDFNKLNNNPDNIERMDKQEHILFHTQNLDRTLHNEASKQKARVAHRDPAYREKVRKIMTKPGMRKMLSTRAKKQWEDENYKQYMAKAFRTFFDSNEAYRKLNAKMLNEEQQRYWSSARNRRRQSRRTREFFESNPERRKELQEIAQKQWEDSELRRWRSRQTKKQWTPKFRAQRKESYNKTYLRKGIETLHRIYRKYDVVDYVKYDAVRKKTNDKSLLKHSTLATRFFNGDVQKLEEAIINHNHRIKEIAPFVERLDVYDMEVQGTHNFALASGVFVHNSSKQGRDRRIQAILPLRGKILNVERARLDRMLASTEIKALVVALGTAIGDVFDITKLRYHKIIIATDADVDGAHIRTLLLTLFYRHFRPVIEDGFLYIAQPPLYKIKKGKESFYAYSEEEKMMLAGDADTNVMEENEKAEADITDDSSKEEFLREDSASANLPADKAGASADKQDKPIQQVQGKPIRQTQDRQKVSIQRYKGLGEMNPEELWETTMDPKQRVLKQVTIEDGQEADKIFDILMGSDVAPRKSFIQSNAKLADLDV